MDHGDFNPVPGIAEQLAPGLQRILAPNPSPMTWRGTNTYVLGADRVVVVDPGPLDAAHLDALTRALDGRTISDIIVTHSHLDHSPLAPRLASLTGAPVLAFGDSREGRSAVMSRLAAEGYAGGGEGIDHGFQPDRTIADGQILDTPAGPIGVMHTPGHMGNHICLTWHDAVFTGDLVMGWATSLVSPPDGDVTDFIASCRKLQDFGAATFYPGHGAPIGDPAGRLDWLIAHRLSRRDQVLEALSDNALTVEQLTALIYADVADALWPAAARNVFAQLIELHEAGEITAKPRLNAQAVFERM